AVRRRVLDRGDPRPAARQDRGDRRRRRRPGGRRGGDAGRTRARRAGRLGRGGARAPGARTRPLGGDRRCRGAGRRGLAGRRRGRRPPAPPDHEVLATRLKETPMTVTLECRDLTKTYTSTDPPPDVLRGVDLSVRSGEFVAVMGASGSGKSTLLHGLSGMDRPTGGTVHLEGRDLPALTDAQMSRARLTRIGFVFQQAHFLPNLSIRDNVLLPALKAAPREQRAVLARVDALLERFGIAHVRDHAITQVSGGQLQRASICRALA